MAKTNSLNFCSINIGGMASNQDKQDALLSYLKVNQIHICCLQELVPQHTNTDFKLKSLNFDGYTAISSGVETGILILNAISNDPLNEIKLNFKNHWITWTAILGQREILVIGSYYRSPSATDMTYEDIMQIQSNMKKIKNKFKKRKVNFVIAGDYNATHKFWNNQQ